MNDRTGSLTDLQAVIGYNFKDGALLGRSLTHASFVGGDGKMCASNERLEFLGDAVLELVSSDYLYKTYPDSAEGVLSRIRAASVCEATLCRLARGINLSGYLRLGKGEEMSGGRSKPSIQANAVEALIGALYLDGGLSAARAFILQYLPGIVEKAVAGEYVDFKTALQEELQAGGPIAIKYEITDQEGPDHAKTFRAAVYADGKLLGRGSGGSKKEAEQNAARDALAALGAGG